MQDNDRKELFSLAYVRAVCASVGFSVDKPELDRDSIDLKIQSVGPGGLLGNPEINVQVKSTAANEATPSHVAHELPIKNYNDLRESHTFVPRALIVVLLKAEFDEWITAREQRMVTELGAVGYWHILTGAEALESQ